MKGILVTERYARSLFELAVERNELEQVYGDVLLIRKTCVESRDFLLLLKSPIIQPDKKEKILVRIFGDRLSRLTLGFLRLLVRKRREMYVAEIAGQFIEQYQDYKNIIPVVVKTAAPLSEAVKKEILAVMKTYSDAVVELEGSVDPELIGGFVLSWKDKQYDASLSHQIEKLRRAIAKINLYVKEF